MAGVRKVRNGTIDLVKFLMTLLVMVYHTYRYFPGGYIAVDFFFLVSGFLMAKSMRRSLGYDIFERALGRETIGFVLHRAGGIFPYYFVAWVMGFVTTAVIKDLGSQEIIDTLIMSPYNLFMVEMAGNYDMGYRIQGSWYISALLIAILVIYPVRRKWPNVFDSIIAPLLGLFFVGYVYQQGYGVSSLVVGYDENLHAYGGVIRGVVEMALGCSCYRLCCNVERINFKPFARLLISIVEWGGYVFAVLCTWHVGQTNLDLVLIPVFAVSIILSFSGKGLLAGLFKFRLFSVLGEFSLSMYLTHELMKNVVMINCFKDVMADNTKFFLMYFELTLLAAFICHFTGKLLVLICRALRPALRAAMIYQDRT